MTDLFNQTFSDFHGKENNKESEEIYIANMKRLNENSRIILNCLAQGQQLNATNFMVYGIKYIGYNDKPKTMAEYRKRIHEIRSAGIDVKDLSGESGVKTYYLEPSEQDRVKKDFQHLLCKK